MSVIVCVSVMNLELVVSVLALLFSFFVVGALFGAMFSKPLRKKIFEILHIKELTLSRSILNPILRPGKLPWTAEAVMNPAAAVINGRTHLLYRAIGMDGISRLGYASSPDGITFDKRLSYPAYIARNPRNLLPHQRRYSPVMYPSGGSWGGCEDPRMVVIDGRVYVTFNMFDGWDFLRVAAISMKKEDFVAGDFSKWSGPYILSKPKEVQKNWVLFPEKINGKFAILHSVAPKIDIAYRNSIEAIGTTEPLIDSWVGPRNSLPAREGVWDSYVRSAGPPPIKTEYGWLVFYHAVNKSDPSRYQLGAMLLDLTDPTKELYRSSAPILSPNAHYENDGKPGIVYACGAVVRDGELYVYYGGADKVVCVATTPLKAFLEALIKGTQPKLITTPARAT